MAVERLDTLAILKCQVDTWVWYINWYFHQEGTAPKWLLYLDMSTGKVQRDAFVNADKVSAQKGKDSYSCALLVQRLRKSDEGVYYCAAWEPHSYSCCPGLRAKRSPYPRALHTWHVPLALELWGCPGVNPQLLELLRASPL